MQVKGKGGNLPDLPAMPFGNQVTAQLTGNNDICFESVVQRAVQEERGREVQGEAPADVPRRTVAVVVGCWVAAVPQRRRAIDTDDGNGRRPRPALPRDRAASARPRP